MRESSHAGRGKGAPGEAGTGSVRTACSYCGVGCGIVLDAVRDPVTGRRLPRRCPATEPIPRTSGGCARRGPPRTGAVRTPPRGPPPPPHPKIPCGTGLEVLTEAADGVTVGSDARCSVRGEEELSSVD
ncbi:hypothetical protein, partial [Streptomyces zhihengii]